MNCDQIQALLDDYKANELPGFKVTWVAQHLGGCPPCRTYAARPSIRCKPLHLVEWLDEEPLAEPPAAFARWIPALGLALILCATLSMLLIQWQNQALAGMARPQRLRYQSTAQTQQGVTAKVTQLIRHEDVVTGAVRFFGHGLMVPEELKGRITVVDSEGASLTTTVQKVVPGQDSLSVGFQVTLPPEVKSFRIIIGAIYMEMTEQWSVQLPRPVNGLNLGGVRLLGNRADMRLVAYGLVGDMLVVHLRAPLAPGRLTGSRFDLLDAAGTQIAPSLLQETTGPEDHAFWVQYPVPRETHLPLSLVGERFSRREVGPWLLPISLLP